LGSSIPSLTTLVLTSNNLSELADVESLRSLHKLTHLVLLENPITRKEVGKTFHCPGYPGLLSDGSANLSF
jgi:Leucine-rich repeat (LRR) protein